MSGDSGVDSIIIDHRPTGKPVKRKRKRNHKTHKKITHNQALRCFAWLLAVCGGLVFAWVIWGAINAYFVKPYFVLALAY